MLTQRRGEILRIIVSEYISGAVPVASETIARKYRLGVSPATIRNEMTRLEDEGYIIRPHTSAGAIPSDKGYRYYVESLVDEAELAVAEQFLIRHLFHQVEMKLEEWTELAAAILAGLVRNVAVVTLPKAAQPRLKHLELVALQDFLALLVVVLRETKLKRQLLFFDQAVSQWELDALAGKLNAALSGLTWPEILARVSEPSPIEEEAINALVRIMQEEEERRYEEHCLDGLRHILSQPEFSSSRKVLDIMGVLEGKNLSRVIPPHVLDSNGVHVIIGAENTEEVMRDCSVVATRYGIPGEVCGAIGVVGPTRMQYSRAISSVRYLASVMSGLVSEIYR